MWRLHLKRNSYVVLARNYERGSDCNLHRHIFHSLSIFGRRKLSLYTQVTIHRVCIIARDLSSRAISIMADHYGVVVRFP